MQRAGTPPATVIAAAITLGATAVVWAWWAGAEGGYFGTVMYPGLIVLCAAFVLVSSRAAWGSRVKLPGPAKLALVALLALAGWSALSALWSPSPDVAIADSQRILGYTLAFGLGIWLCILLGSRVHLALAPLALAGLFAGVLTVAGLLTTDEVGRYIDAGTLEFPLAYRNANAAFFLIALWPAVGLAAARELDWRLRALALGTATLCIELAMLCQSRGSVIGVALALAVYLVVAHDRARAVGWLALAVLPALVVIPDVTDIYQAASIENYDGLAEARAAGRATMGGAALAILIALPVAFYGRRMASSPERAEFANRTVALGAAGAVALGLVAFVIATGDPFGWVGDRFDEFQSQGTPHSDTAANRFSVGAGSERDDLWSVALDNAGDEPLLGLGGGGFQYSYLQGRSEEGIESVRDAHSVELEFLSELGFPGLALLILALGGAVAGAWRARRLSPQRAALTGVALTAGAYWLGHASLDWFWAYPAVTAPVFGLLGSACAPAAGAPEEARATGWRRTAAVGTVVLALSVIPPFLAERYVNNAYAVWRADPEQADSDLERARDLNPLSLEPLLAEGGIARAQDDRERALAAFSEAADKRPEEWASWYFIAALTRTEDPRRARAALDRALELNPLSRTVAELEEKFDRPRG
jgi:hypothetical protein